MKTILTNIYRFSELTEKAKNKVRNGDASVMGYQHTDEAFNSIEALAREFGGKLKEWEVDFFQNRMSYMRFEFEEPKMNREEIAEKLATLGDFNPETGKGLGDCKLTGYSFDEDALDGFRRRFYEGESDVERLMNGAFATWLDAVQSDCSAFYEDENFSEHCEINDYWFTEDGELTNETNAIDILSVLKDCVECLNRLPSTDGAYRITCIQQAEKAIQQLNKH